MKGACRAATGGGIVGVTDDARIAAAERAREQLVRAGASLEAKDEKGWRPLHLAAAADHGDVARALVLAGADVEAATDDARRPLHVAAAFGRLLRARLRRGMVAPPAPRPWPPAPPRARAPGPVSYTHLRAHETGRNLV